MEVVHEGWLTKSPPEKRIWKAKWRQRWFVLKHSGQIPGQYILEYYADPTRRKFKGSIDLDQCEQVDAGLQLESRKSNYQHMFDIRTSKRVYYLVANTEADMNKWVECICSVCGLKIHVDDGTDYRYSPQPSQEFVVSATGGSGSLCSNASSVATTSTLPQSPQQHQQQHHPDMNTSSAPVTNKNNFSSCQIEGPSGPYIPISECHTGKPVNGIVLDESNSKTPVLPTKSSRRLSDDFYDIPRQLNPTSDSSLNDDNQDNLLYQVPAAPSAKHQHSSSDKLIANPPRVNWSTYPKDSPLLTYDGTRASIRSCNAAVDSHDSYSNIDNQRSSSPSNDDYEGDSTLKPPPRPPKPPSLRRTKNKSESCASLPNVTATFLYDVPTTATEAQQNSPKDNQLTSSFKVLTPNLSDKSHPSPQSPDEMYDFPRVRTESLNSTVEIRNSIGDKENLNAAVPIGADRSSLRKSNKHSYTNAPPGYFTSTKESVFNYEYRPSLNSFDDQINFTSEYDNQLQRSPVTPNSASYTNIASSSSTPPAVNRELKPRRKGSDSDTSNIGASPTTPTLLLTSGTTLQLAPPPALNRGVSNALAIQAAPVKRSFRKPKTTPSPLPLMNGTPPKIPSRDRYVHHGRDPSLTEDDNYGGNDEVITGKQVIAAPCRFEGNEIHYLDLDLDSDTNSQSPRTPNEAHHQRSGSNISNSKDYVSNTTTSQPVQPQTVSSASTVYKTVDFLKTEAFNKMRLTSNKRYHES